MQLVEQALFFIYSDKRKLDSLPWTKIFDWNMFLCHSVKDKKIIIPSSVIVQIFYHFVFRLQKAHRLKPFEEKATLQPLHEADNHPYSGQGQIRRK